MAHLKKADGISRSSKSIQTLSVGACAHTVYLTAVPYNKTCIFLSAVSFSSVTVMEKNGKEQAGGRLNEIVQSCGADGDFRFDTGPSLLLLPDTYRESFRGDIHRCRRDSHHQDRFFLQCVSPSFRYVGSLDEFARTLDGYQVEASAELKNVCTPTIIMPVKLTNVENSTVIHDGLCQGTHQTLQ